MKKRIFAAVIGTVFAVSAFAPLASVSANASEISEVQQFPQEVHYGWLKDIFRDDDDRKAPPPHHETRRPAPPPPHHGPYDDDRRDPGGHGPRR